MQWNILDSIDAHTRHGRTLFFSLIDELREPNLAELLDMHSNAMNHLIDARRQWVEHLNLIKSGEVLSDEDADDRLYDYLNELLNEYVSIVNELECCI